METPKDINISYLGTWVLPEEDLCNKGNFEILEYCYDDHDEMFSDFIYVKSLYKLTLPIIGDLLNKHHSLSWSSRSFKIFYGAWLHEYLPVIRERYKTIQTALRTKPSHSFVLTDFNISLSDAADFKKKITEDDYNHYLYSKLVKFIDYQVYENSYFVSKSINHEAKGIVTMNLLKNISKDFLSRNLQLLCNVATRGSKAAVDRSYFSKKHFINLIIGSFPRITPIVHLPTLRRSGLKQDLAVRDKLQKSFCSLFSPKNDFETFLAENLIYDMPLSFIESFKNVLHESSYVNLKNKNYLSSNAILSNQILQCAAANQLSSTSDLIIAQHGGSYGIAKWSMQEFYELNTADKYISFGWEKREFSNISKISHPKLLLKNNAGKLSNQNILYITCAPSRYFDRNWSVLIPGSAIIDYYKNILVLLKAIKPHLQRHISLRLAPSDLEYKVGVGKLLGKGIKLAKGNFYKELNAASLVICDHNQTTMLESMGSNRPTIIVWNSDHNKIDQLAMPLFKELAEVGIFYSSHRKAAAFINDILDKNGIDDWWRDTSRQNAVSSFVMKFCKKNNNWIADYQKVLGINKN